jgi:phosphohistidine phosphatase SixA
MKYLVVFFFWLLCLPQPGIAEPVPFQEKAVDVSLLRQIRQGGYVLYMRHATTDTSNPDQVPLTNLNDCSAQRVLTAEGRALAKRLGQMIRTAQIPVGDVYASPFCRTRETAQAAFGHYEVDNRLMSTANMLDAETVRTMQATAMRLSTPVPAGANRVLVGHASNLVDLIGYFPKPEGAVVLFRPLGEGHFEYLGSIRPEHWPELLRQLKHHP